MSNTPTTNMSLNPIYTGLHRIRLGSRTLLRSPKGNDIYTGTIVSIKAQQELEDGYLLQVVSKSGKQFLVKKIG